MYIESINYTITTFKYKRSNAFINAVGLPIFDNWHFIYALCVDNALNAQKV